MNAIYLFVSGPLLWVTFIIFIGGIIYRLISMGLLTKKKDPLVYEYMSFKFVIRSIFHWIIPYNSENMRRNPIMTLVSFMFHIFVILLPIFLFAHVVLWKESWNISWCYIPDVYADIMTLVVIGSCIFFIVRRIIKPEVKYLTSVSDYIIIMRVTPNEIEIGSMHCFFMPISEHR